MQPWRVVVLQKFIDNPINVLAWHELFEVSQSRGKSIKVEQ